MVCEAQERRMDGTIYAHIRAKNHCWDLITVTAESVTSRNIDDVISEDECLEKVKLSKAKHIYRNEGLHFCVFLKELRTSKAFRLSFINCLLQSPNKDISRRHNKRNIKTILWTIDDNVPYIIDKEWCIRMNECAVERQNLDTVMSWLSTLGGACSALGDYDSNFARRAGEISVKQMEIALRLGDPFVMSRCCLYLAISMIQQCRFKDASGIVRNEYLKAHSLPKEARDHRLIKMCLGIWTKLRHEKQLHRLETRAKFNSSRTI